MGGVVTPAWVHDAVFYQVFPDRFARSDRVAKPTNLQAWGAEPTPQGYQGGDLLGVVEHLDHIQQLGATALYLNPVFTSASNHRYHTNDYLSVDPMLGGDDALRELLDAAHQRGMKVVLDGVFNHTGRGFHPFTDILENGPQAAWLDWFTVEHWPVHAYDGHHRAGYRGWLGMRELPQLNSANPQVQSFVLDVAEHWLRFGIDGWRLDVPAEITAPGYWEAFRQRVKGVDPQAYLVGEVWHEAQEWLAGGRFDGVMNYLFAGPTIAFTAGPRVVQGEVQGRDYVVTPPLTGWQYGEAMERLLGLYDWQATLAQLNLLDSHDTARLLTLAGGDPTTVRLATILLLTFPGAPCIYYGDEIGLPGGNDPTCRRAMPWDEPERWDRACLDRHTALVAVRHALPALRTGGYHRLYADDAVYAFARVLGDQRAVVAVNVADEPRTIHLPLTGLVDDGVALTPRYGDQGGRVAGGVVRLVLPARDGVVLNA